MQALILMVLKRPEEVLGISAQFSRYLYHTVEKTIADRTTRLQHLTIHRPAAPFSPELGEDLEQLDAGLELLTHRAALSDRDTTRSSAGVEELPLTHLADPRSYQSVKKPQVVPDNVE